ncbi:MAG TPA: SpoIIE family protein phosphatase [Gammaproteobacteria bacterium]|nr:SpoIIE family protein phosphatase [Gammaproteobacteria bacterium]
MTRDKELAEEIRIAHRIQMSTLPAFLPDVAGYDFFGKFWPADETGGDTFDLVSVADDTVFLLLADATGHGIGPALSALQVQSMLRVALRLGASLEDAFRHVNAQMAEDLPEGHFVTAFFGLLNTATSEVDYLAAGQGPILHFREHGEIFDWFDPACPPMGFMEHVQPPDSQTLKLERGDLLALISDGIFEYENEHGEFFGMDRVEEIIRSGRGAPMDDLAKLIVAAAREFGAAAVQRDDITIVLIRRMPAPGHDRHTDAE